MKKWIILKFIYSKKGELPKHLKIDGTVIQKLEKLVYKIKNKIVALKNLNRK